MAPLDVDVFSGCWQIMYRFLSVVDIEHLLFLGTVEATFESSLVTMMLELHVDVVKTVTELTSSCQVLTMNVEELLNLCWNCLRLLGHVYAL